MATPDPEGFSMLTRILAAGAAVIAPVAGAYKWVDYRLDKKADKEAVRAAYESLNNEMTVQRGNIGKLFDKVADESKVGEERHREILMHLLSKGK